ncbi:hypothetical protein B0T13DRAFT_513368 [Neurospora crassa]|nr:hypothetical protein B0T13DRAFT_408662 [Neurospora crassa]KAK3493084.1 hypothetical protein B0T13DRAFT_513368 [Neurospora crassa]
MAILLPRNDVLNVHPAPQGQHLSVHGSDWLWAATALFAFNTLVIFALKFKASRGERLWHYIWIVTNLVATFAYFAMAANLAWDVVSQRNQVRQHGPTRQIFWAKYVLWVVSFPAAILAMGILSGVSWATIVFNIFLSWIWVIGYLVAAYVPSNYKWGFFAFAALAHIFLAFETLFRARSSANRVGINRDYTMLSGWTNLLWLLYPIAWGVSDGGNVIGVTKSMIFFGILDVLFITTLSYAFVVLSRRWDYSRLNIAFTQYGRVPITGTYPEKHATTDPHSGVTDPHTAAPAV